MEEETTEEKETLPPFEGYYEYPIGKYKGQQLRNECRISQEVIDSMTSEQLAQAVADYPFLVGTMTSTKVDTSSLKRNCDAYIELLKRPDGKDAIIAKIAELDARSRETKDIPLAVTVEDLKKIIYYEEELRDKLTDEDKEVLKLGAPIE